MKNLKLKIGSTVAVASAALVPAISYAAIDVTAATGVISGDGTTAITAVGTALITLAGTVLVFKWVKAAFF